MITTATTPRDNIEVYSHADGNWTVLLNGYRIAGVKLRSNMVPKYSSFVCEPDIQIAMSRQRMKQFCPICKRYGSEGWLASHGCTRKNEHCDHGKIVNNDHYGMECPDCNGAGCENGPKKG